ncbi:MULTISPECIES: MazG-like family protein [unclassified Sporosarcina]|uniref:MazG-like family protein n=1 Tax=unclassified Sporosarcina TaxID=2647733 RepID=UPI00203AF141|nr:MULTISPECIES: MazG-like family protein [unclassified Sporosarcina]
MNAPNLQDTTDRVRVWAITRGLDEADPLKQMLKLIEEVGEIAAALARGDMQAAKDGIGDVHVVQTILSMQLGTSIEECAGIAYNEIKDRKGKMVNGVFVKESDLPTERAE